MAPSNPYKPSSIEPEPNSEPEAASLSQRSVFNAAVLAELGVKLIGLMFVLDGVGGLIAQVTTLFIDRQQMIGAGIQPYTNSVTAGGFTSSFFYLFAGVYLVTNGKLAIELILMTDSKPDVIDGQD